MDIINSAAMFAAIVVFMIIVMFVIEWIYIILTGGIKSKSITIKEWRVKNEKSNFDSFLVFSEDIDGNTIIMENAISLALLQFKTAEFQKMVMENVGKEVEVKYVGIRIPFLGVYPKMIH